MQTNQRYLVRIVCKYKVSKYYESVVKMFRGVINPMPRCLSA